MTEFNEVAVEMLDSIAHLALEDLLAQVAATLVTATLSGAFRRLNSDSAHPARPKAGNVPEAGPADLARPGSREAGLCQAAGSPAATRRRH